MSISTGSTFGNTIRNNLLETTTQDQIKSGQMGAAQALEQAEDRLLELISIGGDQKKLEAFATKTGLGAKDNDGNYSQASMMTALETIINRASRAFMTAQKIGDRMHEMMMEVIKAIGR